MFPHQAFVLHSAYPDGTWRGLEKCVSTVAHDGVLVFQERAAAEAHLASIDEDVREYLQVVEVTLVTPDVRAPLDSATQEKVDPRIPPSDAVDSVEASEHEPRPGHEKMGDAPKALTVPVDSRCGRCGGLIPKGSRAVHEQGVGVYHDGECPTVSAGVGCHRDEDVEAERKAIAGQLHAMSIDSGGRAVEVSVTVSCFVCKSAVHKGSRGVFVRDHGVHHEGCYPQRETR
jgi:hypothetical protein